MVFKVNSWFYGGSMVINAMVIYIILYHNYFSWCFFMGHADLLLISLVI